MPNESHFSFFVITTTREIEQQMWEALARTNRLFDDNWGWLAPLIIVVVVVLVVAVDFSLYLDHVRTRILCVCVNVRTICTFSYDVSGVAEGYANLNSNVKKRNTKFHSLPLPNAINCIVRVCAAVHKVNKKSEIERRVRRRESEIERTCAHSACTRPQ